MNVSNNAKHSAYMKADKFWDEVYVTLEEFDASANKKSLPLKQVVAIAGIIYSNPPTSGEVRDGTPLRICTTVGCMMSLPVLTHIPKTAQKHSRNI